MSEDFPLPETPVTQVSVPRGIVKFTFLRLWPLAPFNFKKLPFPFRRFSGISIVFFSFRYKAVKESLSKIVFKVPALIICPPCSPAFGPISTIKSASCIISLSCSTTKTVFPASLNFFSDLINFSLSLWCNPIEGSSRT